MAGGGPLDIIGLIQALVSDKLQVNDQKKRFLGQRSEELYYNSLPRLLLSPPVAKKAQAEMSNTPTNPVSKAGNKKPAKGGRKDAKDGNILSFFKNV